jgi:hypothetical protein
VVLGPATVLGDPAKFTTNLVRHLLAGVETKIRNVDATWLGDFTK